MGSIWDRFGIDLGSIWTRFGIGLGSIWDRSGVDLGSIWGRSGVDLGSIWGRSVIILGSFWGHSGITLASLWAHFREFLRKTPKFQNRSKTSPPASGGPKLSLCDPRFVKNPKIEKWKFRDFWISRILLIPIGPRG